jgi:DNA repair exonuclease SbcCD ATPase subunit
LQAKVQAIDSDDVVPPLPSLDSHFLGYSFRLEATTELKQVDDAEQKEVSAAKKLLEEQKTQLEEQKMQLDEQKMQMAEAMRQLETERKRLEEEKVYIGQLRNVTVEEQAKIDEQRKDLEEKELRLADSVGTASSSHTLSPIQSRSSSLPPSSSSSSSALSALSATYNSCSDQRVGDSSRDQKSSASTAAGALETAVGPESKSHVQQHAADSQPSKASNCCLIC